MLINREHSRLSSQVKTLERVLHAPFSDKEHQRLVQLAANWRSLLAFDDGAPKLADALEVFIAAYRQQSPDQEKLHDEVVFQAGVYRMGHWALVKHFIPGVTDCLDNFGSVLPKHRDCAGEKIRQAIFRGFFPFNGQSFELNPHQKRASLTGCQAKSGQRYA
ncbi:MAG: hypothetical protein EOM24_31820 [Chloroflexia bacterium]|nr:hypothetical protein [Chloroflexia bacterium]